MCAQQYDHETAPGILATGYVPITFLGILAIG